METKQIGDYTVVSDGGVPFGLMVHHHPDDRYGLLWSFDGKTTCYDEVKNKEFGLSIMRSTLYPEMEPASQYFKVAHHEYTTGLRDEDASAKHFACALDQIGIIDVIESGENNEFYMNAPYISGVYVLRTDSGITFRAGSYIFPPDTPCIFMEAQRQKPEDFQIGPVVATAKFEWRQRPSAAAGTDEIRKSLLKRMREIIRRKHS